MELKGRVVSSHSLPSQGVSNEGNKYRINLCVLKITTLTRAKQVCVKSARA